jgi:hypothetical protein
LLESKVVPLDSQEYFAYRRALTAYQRRSSSTRVAPKQQVDSRHRQAAGLEEPEPQRKPSASDEKQKCIPTLRQFQATFDEWVATAKAEQNGTIKFYQESYRKTLAYGPWADLRLDQIDESHIEAFKAWALK